MGLTILESSIKIYARTIDSKNKFYFYFSQMEISWHPEIWDWELWGWELWGWEL